MPAFACSLYMKNEYLDINGRPIPENKKPYFRFLKSRRTSGDEIIAEYVTCPRPTVGGLIWVGHCLNCQYNNGMHVRYLDCIFNKNNAEHVRNDRETCLKRKKMQKK